ncbi:hypothetical protein AG0111_0g11825 [Alternaria gaisen]|uniref:Uncharacterized protein n=1 Tax=Alternaria gaisen TaxID=167740 RepID=A0ACB6F6H9_9PLEO|nr:hypothetical protein AG0111_0g11825 [Alternaria gaisen]
MATPGIVLSIHGRAHEHHCIPCKSSRYHLLTWKHVIISPEQMKAILDEALPPPFQAFISNQPILSPTVVAHNLVDWYWDPDEEVWLDQTLEVLVDIGATAFCVGLCRELDQFDIALSGRKPIVQSFRTSGTWFYSQEGTPAEDSETASSRVYRKQTKFRRSSGETFGQAIVAVQLIVSLSTMLQWYSTRFCIAR